MGAAFLLAFWLLERMGQRPLKGAVLAAVPLLVTGGIHMDGFLDTCDARASWGDREKKLEILKDSHTGAFAVISGVLYLLLLAGVYSMLTWEGGKACGGRICPFAGLQRTFGGPSSKRQGKRHAFRAYKRQQPEKNGGGHGLLDFAFRSGSRFGKSYRRCVFASFSGITGFLFCRMAKKEFGGITGDLAGYFLELCELTLSAGLLLSGRLL